MTSLQLFATSLGLLPLMQAAASAQPAVPPADAPAGKRPNIVLILADDMGYSDLGCYGGEIHTPNLDKLAAEGVKFTQFYNTPRCCPTRASLLTGVYPHQAGVGAMNQNLGPEPYQGHLNDHVVTLAETLRTGGYHTAMVGKWHLSNMTVSPSNPDSKALLNFQKDAPVGTPAEKQTWPNHRGFEDFVGTIPGVSNYYDPYGLVHNDESITPPNPETFYYTDFITDTAAADVRRLAAEEAPFFLYVAHVAPHWPLQAKEQDVAKYREVYAKGWEALREGRERRLRESGMLDAGWPLSPRYLIIPDNPHPETWEDVRNREWEIERMSVYAAQVDALDQGVGRLMKAIEESGEADNTLVIFLSDNGGCAEDVQPGWYDIPNRTRDGREIHIGNDPKIMPGPETSWQSYGPRWANVSNTPFRLFKHWTNEGGISTPLILHWPAGISRDGSVVKQVGQIMDLAPTCLEAAGVKHPDTFEGHPVLPLEGRSLWPLVAGETLPPHAPIFWEHEGHRGVRDGQWKLIAGEGAPWELYDVELDRTELHDLSAERPAVVKKLAAEHDAWAKRVGARDWPIRREN